MRTVFIVQEHESGFFLYPEHGEAGFTKLLKDAGRFTDYEGAFETAKYCCDGAFSIVEFLEI